MGFGVSWEQIKRRLAGLEPDGVSSISTPILFVNGSELTSDGIDLLEGLTATVDDLNLLTGQEAGGLLAADFTKLAAISAPASDINKLDGTTAVKNDFDILFNQAANGLTGLDLFCIRGRYVYGLRPADLDKLADITVTAAAINLVNKWLPYTGL